MVRSKYKVDCVNGQWCVVVNKGKQAGKVVEIANNSEEAWIIYDKKYKGQK